MDVGRGFVGWGIICVQGCCCCSISCFCVGVYTIVFAAVEVEDIVKTCFGFGNPPLEVSGARDGYSGDGGATDDRGEGCGCN